MKKRTQPEGTVDLGFGFRIFPALGGWALERPKPSYLSTFPSKEAAEARGRQEINARLGSVRRQAVRDALATCERRIAEERAAVEYLVARGFDEAGSDLRFARSELAHQEALRDRLKAREAELSTGTSV